MPSITKTTSSVLIIALFVGLQFRSHGNLQRFELFQTDGLQEPPITPTTLQVVPEDGDFTTTATSANLMSREDAKDDANASLFMSGSTEPSATEYANQAHSNNNISSAQVILPSVQDSNKPQSSTAIILQNQHDFYEYHFEQMLKLFQNRSAAMHWATRKDYESLWNHFDQDLFWDTKKESGSTTFDLERNKHKRFIRATNICKVAKAFEEYRNEPNAEPFPHVLLFKFNENWGGFSQEVPGKTTGWVADLMKGWKMHGCSNSTIFQYINHPETLTVITTQFQIM
jgi:hypothetical protein